MATVPTYDRPAHGNRDAGDEAPEPRPLVSVRPWRPSDIHRCGQQGHRYTIRIGSLTQCLCGYEAVQS